MLRTPRIRKLISQPFVCWRCLSRYRRSVAQKSLSTIAGVRPTLNAVGAKHSSVKDGQSSFSKNFASLATVKPHEEAIPASVLEQTPPDEPPAESTIRQRLRTWEIEHAARTLEAFREIALPAVKKSRRMPETVRNSTASPPTSDFVEEREVDLSELAEEVLDPQELVDLGPKRLFFRRGDLVEMINGRDRELAIFIRDVGRYGQFYSRSGKWMTRDWMAPRFFIPNFVKPHELDPILPYLPPEEADTTKLEWRQMLHLQAPPRDVARNLLSKMDQFWVGADIAYQQAPGIFDNAHAALAQKNQYTYLTLEQMADRLLTNTFPKDDGGKFSTTVLYALHRSIFLSDIGFRCPKVGFLRVGGDYEIAPLEEVKNILVVRDLVRQYRVKQSGKLHNFILKARKLIDESRKTRQFTPHGTLGCSKIQSHDVPYRFGQREAPFAAEDQRFLRFFESWASLNSFALHSSWHCLGSEILRYIDRYDENVYLDEKTAWTFMQEIGAHPPWENRAMYTARIPKTGRQIPQIRSASTSTSTGYVKDKLRKIRKDWGDIHVFCIDSPETTEIDDGLSVETTQEPDEFWVHIHTADPAAHLEVESGAMQTAEQKISTAYFPERVDPMLPDKAWVQNKLSLGKKRPCLTFSIKINLNGEILEESITPGIVNNVSYLEPSVVYEVATGERPTERRTYVIGSESLAKIASRKLLKADEISGNAKKDLQTLYMLAAARQKNMSARGDVSLTKVTPKISVSFGGSAWKNLDPLNVVRHHGDPTVQLSIDSACFKPDDMLSPQVDTVRPFMIAAGEVAARWCHARGIPIPYRVTPLNEEKENPYTCFLRVINPILEKHGQIPAGSKELSEYFKTLGRVVPSTTPGPHVSLGGTLYTKTTSPLRRFPDLLVHSQIEAALLEEARAGQSLVGNTRQDFLPFSKARIDALIPHIFGQEALLNRAQKDAEAFWRCYFLLRAWKFGELELPSPLLFQANNLFPEEGVVLGAFHGLLVPAQIEELGTLKIKEGDTLEVEIADVDLYNHKVTVKPLRVIST